MKERLAHLNNNFDFLRLLGAFLVIISHSYALTLAGADPLFQITGYEQLSFLGVAMFFVISGYLITQSWHFDPTLHFIWKRFLRIIPGLIGVSIFTVFILGSLVTTFSLKEYFINPMTWVYFKIIALYGIGPYLPGVFESNPYPNAVNGSLWTLQVEFSMYILLMISGFIGLLAKKKLMAVLSLSLILTYFINEITHFTLFKSIGFSNSMVSIHSILIYPIFFVIGSVCFLYRDRIKWDKKFLLLFLIVWILSFNTIFFYLASLVCLPYIILYIAQLPLPFINKSSKYGDFSYGLYIYAFPIQQSIVMYLGSIHIIEMIFLSSLFTLPLSAISWKLIESKALKLKKLHLLDLLKTKIIENKNL